MDTKPDETKTNTPEAGAGTQSTPEDDQKNETTGTN
jgi:hypothetical protein